MSSSGITYSSQQNLDSVKLSQEEVDSLPDLPTNQMGISHNFAFKESVINREGYKDGLYMVTIQVSFLEGLNVYLVNSIYRTIILEK